MERMRFRNCNCTFKTVVSSVAMERNKFIDFSLCGLVREAMTSTLLQIFQHGSE